METATPLTRCDTCHTVFEVPREILDSADSRVRCGECLQVFDASVNLHSAQRPDFSLVDATLTETADATADGAADNVVAVAPKPPPPAASRTTPPPVPGPAPIVHGASATPTGTASKEDNHLEATMADFDLFSDNASLPETSFEFGENTIDAIRLNFDLVEDEDDDTLNDSLFSNDVTIDADRMELAAGEAVELDTPRPVPGATSDKSLPSPESSVDESLSKASHTGFVVEDNDSPNTIEFDFRDIQGREKDSPQTPAVALQQPPPNQSQSQFPQAPGPVAAAVPASATPPDTASAAPEPVTSVATGVSANADRATADVVAFPNSARPGQTPSTSAMNGNTMAGSGSGTHGNAATAPVRRPVLGRRLWQLFLLLLTVALVAALYGYRQRDNLADNSLTRPFYSAWCSFRGCAVPARFDKSKLKVVEKNIVSHPDLSDALIITVLLENRADFEQRYPVLFLWLSDSTRRTVASNEFDPSVYLPDNDLSAGSTLAPGQRQKIAIDVRDPGRRAVSLELSLR